MVRLIDADALIESLTINPTECMGCPEPEWIDEFMQVLNTTPSVLINCIQCKNYYETEDDNGVVGHCKIDTAHLSERTGEWIDVNGNGSLWRCSRCKDTACCDGNYCPTCGGRMVKHEHD